MSDLCGCKGCAYGRHVDAEVYERLQIEEEAARNSLEEARVYITKLEAGIIALDELQAKARHTSYVLEVLENLRKWREEQPRA